MQKEIIEGQSTIQQLLDECRAYIKGQKTIAGYHCGPNIPILFITMGDTCEKERIDIVKETIELAWNNIQGQLIIQQYPELGSKEDFYTNLENDIVSLKSLPDGIFLNYNETKVYLFLQGDDQNFLDYVQLLEDNIPSKIEALQLIVVLFVNEKNKEKRNEARKQIAILSHLKSQNKVQGVVVLSNCLRGGKILNEEKELEQYKIAADIAFLSNSYDIAQKCEYDISRNINEILMKDDEICTAAYICLSKPDKEIVHATLSKILELHQKGEEELTQGIDDSSHEFRNRLNNNQKDGLFGLDRVYREEIMEKFSKDKIELEDFPYFDEMKDLIKKQNNSLEELNSLMQEKTNGVWSLFIECNYMCQVSKFLEDKEEFILNQVKDYMKSEFSYTEWLKYVDNSTTRADILEDLNQLQPSAMSFDSNDLSQRLRDIIVKQTREYFYKEIQSKRIFITAFSEVETEVKQFVEIVKNMRNLLKIGYVHNEITQYYENEVRSLYQNESYRKILNEPCDSIEVFANHVKYVFEQFVTANRDKYNLSFEKELAARINVNVNGTVLKNLGFDDKRLTEECRLNYGQIPDGSSFCIAFAEAEFLDELKAAMGDVFPTSRQESVERLMLCPFSCDTYKLEEDNA